MCKNIILYDTYIIRLYSRIYGYSRDVDGVVEMDQIFVAQSFKGNHKKSGFVMPRAPRKRGKQIKKEGYQMSKCVLLLLQTGIVTL